MSLQPSIIENETCRQELNGVPKILVVMNVEGPTCIMKVKGTTLYKGPFTLGGIPDGIPCGIALVQSVHIYLFLRDTRAVRERYRGRSLRERFPDRKPRSPDVLLTNQRFCFN